MFNFECIDPDAYVTSSDSSLLKSKIKQESIRSAIEKLEKGEKYQIAQMSSTPYSTVKVFIEYIGDFPSRRTEKPERAYCYLRQVVNSGTFTLCSFNFII